MMFNRASTSASRLPTQLSQSLTFVRGKKTNKSSHFVKEPRVRSYAPFIPQIRSPHDPRAPMPGSSAHTPQPYEFQAYTPKTTSVPLEDSALRLHHSPPPSAPSFTTGAVPTVLQWLGGHSVTLTGEESAPERISPKYKKPSPEMVKDLVKPSEWPESLKARIVELREHGHSQRKVLQILGLPVVQARAVASIAPQSAKSKHLQELRMKKLWNSTPFHQRIKLAITKRRKAFW